MTLLSTIRTDMHYEQQKRKKIKYKQISKKQNK
jgi:hypothetical protein